MQQSLETIMSKQVISVTPNQTVQEAAALMSEHNIGAIPVVENGQIRGMITDRDITLRSTAPGGDAQTPVSECMTNHIVSATPDMSAEEAAQLMAQNQIRRLPIVQNNQVVGMVALGDLATRNQYDMEAEQALTNISTPSRPQQ